MNTGNADPTVLQEADQYDFMEQESAEIIWVKESCNIAVSSTDTKAAVSLQAGLQLAITLVLNITLGDSNRGEVVSEELMQNFNAEQINKQKIFICNSKDVNVTTTDTDLVINIQVLLQLLLALVVMVDIL
ncbi:spore coat protein [Virgibacillus natechei]|uniref:spore coat protein n=1 Tax=Virgibacillus sp. CBA3643 TaxID=2942278 RepID=UPI0035A3B288